MKIINYNYYNHKCIFCNFSCFLRLADDFEKHSELALANPEKHVSNPVRAFQLVKRFTTDWENIVDSYIRSNASEGCYLH